MKINLSSKEKYMYAFKRAIPSLNAINENVLKSWLTFKGLLIL